MPKLNAEILEAAIAGFETQKQKITARIAELRALLSGGPAESAATLEPAKRKRKKFSAASRRKMALAQKARWAKIRHESEPPAPAITPIAKKAKRRISAEGMKKIVAATKARWAKERAEKAAKAKPAVTKKAAPKKAAVKKAVAKKSVKTAPVKKAAVKKTAPAAAPAVAPNPV